MSHRRIHIDTRELEKLNIENLFTTGEDNRPHTDGKLDINTLFCDNVKNKDYKFNSQVLLDGVKKRRQKMKEYCVETYKTCCDTIISANNSGLTDIIYEIPEFVPDCLDYKSIGCLKYIEEKLKEQKISCLILTNIKMFITWNKLEEKLEKCDVDEEKVRSINSEKITNLSECNINCLT